ncbi:hypothetical protein [Nocardioides terrisoli]|uniref:hypothetical protein n=1 Tax=Nocardioides terrisoli TaxID=3388267 RepID=UPI00287B6FD4|nr:hypothetical protein [Nocardioides marmorisolisilvae]
MPVPAAAGLEGKLAFTITVPDSWYELDLEPATRRESIRRLVEERVRDTDLWDQRRTLQKLLEEQSGFAHESGATYCAAFSMPTDAGPVTGSVVVTLVESPGSDAAESFRVLGRSFTEVPRTGDPLAPYAETDMVDLPGSGSCPRTSGIEDTPVGDGGYVRNVFSLTAVPVHELNRVFLVAASSPVLPLADVLLDLFDAVTGTFRVVRPDRLREDPTGPSD